MNQFHIAARNIKLYVLVKIFAKRVFLPLTALYFIDIAGFTLLEIGILSAFFSATQLLAEVPTGYFADKIGRVASIRLGALLAAAATTIYVLVHTKTGIYLGVMLEAVAYSFLGGAGEALIHDSLVVQKRERDYTKILSRAMSVSLIANAILITLVPMTYAWDPRFPFLIGTLAYLILFTVALFMQDVSKVSTSLTEAKFPSLTKLILKKHILLFGLTFGVVAAMFTSPADMFNVALRDYGIRIDLIGWIYGLGSVVGASLGPFIHYLRSIKLSHYLLLDIFMLAITYIAAFSGKPYLLASAMIISISFWRYRRIIYQSYLLNVYPTSYKATLISTMNNLEQLNAIWLPVFITYVIAKTNLTTGFGILAMFALFIAPFFYFSSLRFFNRDPKPVTLVNSAPNIV